MCFYAPDSHSAGGFSGYKPNGIELVYTVFFYCLNYFYLKHYIYGRGSGQILIVSVAILSGLLSLFAILGFLLFRFNITYEGFHDVINFRALYTPVGMLTNDWVGYLLLFLPFGVATTLYSNNHLKLIGARCSFFVVFAIVVTIASSAKPTERPLRAQRSQSIGNEKNTIG